MTKKERHILAEFTIHFLKSRYWLRESGSAKGNMEQREASFQELLDEHETAFDLLTELEPEIERGMDELGNGGEIK